MPKTTRENIAKIVYDSLISSELEAIDELNSTITGLTDAINNLSKILSNKKEPVQLEMFAKIEPKAEIETQKEEPKPVKKKAVKVHVQPVVEPVVEPVAEPVAEPVVDPVVETIPKEKPETVNIESFADLQKKIGDALEKNPALESTLINLLGTYKASRLREVPEDKYVEFYAKFIN